MSFSITFIDRSGAASTIEGSASYAVDEVQEIRVAAPPQTITPCGKGRDLLINFEDGNTTRLVNFFEEGASSPKKLLFQGPDGSLVPTEIPQDACEGGAILPIVSPLGDVATKAKLSSAAAAGALGGMGTALAAAEEAALSLSEGTGIALEETADGAAGENATALKAEGEIPFSGGEKDGAYKAIARLASAEDSVHGPVAGHGVLTPTVEATGSGQGVVKWHFDVEDAEIDYLGAGQTITQRYEIVLEGSGGRSDTTEVTVTLTGSNDAPVITGGTTTGQVTEAVDGSAGENTDILDLGFDLEFADVDLIDIHQVAAKLIAAEDSELGSVAGRGVLTPFLVEDSTGTGSGRIGWHFQVDSSAIDDLAAGQTITQTYEIAISDGHGGTAARQAVVTIVGANDGPVAQAVAAGTQEDGAAIDIAASFTDVDAIDTHTFTVDTTGTIGAVTSNGDGTFRYDPDGKFEHLRAGETATDTFTYTVRDSAGAESTHTVTITITGSNDAPVVPDVTLARDEQFEMGFDPQPDFAGWTVDTSLNGPGTGSAFIDRSGTLISGDDAVAVLQLSGGVPAGSTVWGPMITSATMAGRAGDTIEFQYMLDGGANPGAGDQAHVVGYLIDPSTGQILQTLLNTSASLGTSSGVQTVRAALNFSGEFAIRFHVGSTDQDQGTIMGGTFKLGYVQLETDVLAGNRPYTFDESEFLAGAADAEGDSLDIVSVSAASALGATVTLGPDGKIHYDPRTATGIAAGVEVTDTFEFTVSDGSGGFTTATATVSVMGVGAGVTAAAWPAMAAEGIELSAIFDSSDDDDLFADAGAQTPSSYYDALDLPHAAMISALQPELNGGEWIIT